MTGKDFKSWLNKLTGAWEDKNPEAAASLFSQKAEYWETPFGSPYKTREKVRKLWQEVPKTQEDIKVDTDVISFAKNKGIAHWKAEFMLIDGRKKVILDGIFFCEFDKEELCSLFRQWWVTK